MEPTFDESERFIQNRETMFAHAMGHLGDFCLGHRLSGEKVRMRALHVPENIHTKIIASIDQGFRVRSKVKAHQNQGWGERK